MLPGKSSAARESLHCRNCGACAPEEYCPHCGQETYEHLPTAREFVHEFVLHYFAAEGRLWRTLRMLVVRPGGLTLEYLRGRKRAYVLPLRLYLTLSVVFFVLLRLSVASDVERMTAAFHQSLNDGHSTFTIVDLGFADAVRKADGSFSCTLPAWLCHRIEQRVVAPAGELERRLARLPTELLAHLSTAMFLLLPLFAFYLELAYSRRTYGEHFLFALHVHSFWYLVLLVLLLPMPGWIYGLLQGYLFVYTVIALHAVYASSWWRTTAKALLLGAAYLASLGAVTMLIAIWALVE